MLCVEQLNWYSSPIKHESSTLSQAELQQLALNSSYYPLAPYPSYQSTGDVDPSSLVVNYSAVSDTNALAPVDSKLDSQASSATYKTPLGMI